MIQLDKSYFDDINSDKIQNLINLTQPYFKYRIEMYQRYTRKINITDIMKSMSGNQIMIPFEIYIVNMMKGYLSGKPPAYIVKERKSPADDTDKKTKPDFDEKKEPTYTELYQDKIDYIRRYNDDGATFTELIHDFIITAAAFLYITENEQNEIVYTHLDSRNTACIFDYGTPPYPIALVKIWDETGANGETVQKIEILTADKRRVFNKDGEQIPFIDYGEYGELREILEKPLFWGDVPIVAFENPDNISCFEPVTPLVEMYESIMTNTRNITKYNDEAKLKITGYRAENPILIDEDEIGSDGEKTGKKIKVPNPARTQEEESLYKAKALFINGDGDIGWLLKNFDYSGYSDIIHSRIFNNAIPDCCQLHKFA